MKLKVFLAMLVMGVSAWTLQSCDNDDDDDWVTVPAELTRSLADKHPQATRVEWEAEGGYYVADFYEDGWEKSAETELRFMDLPDAVQTAFRNGGYATWEIEDVDRVERPDREVVYVIEVEQFDQEVDLFYTADGILVKDDTGTGGGNQGGSDYLPSVTVDDFQAFLDERYPGARIIELDREMNGYEVDIVHEGRGKEVIFDLDGNWVMTSWDIRLVEVPEVVKNAALAQYFVETPSASYYLIELERGEREVKVKVAADGTVL